MRRRLAVFVVLALLIALGSPKRAAATSDGWPMYAHDAGGARVNAAETTLSPTSVRAGLAVRWRSAVPGGPVYGTPAVDAGRVYAANIAGNVFALDEADGHLVWLAHVGPVATFPVVVTSSVALTETEVIIGDQAGTVWGLDRATGAIRWAQRPNLYGFPAIWGSPTVATASVKGRKRPVVFVPVASNEETYTTTNAQPCCFSRGSVAALDPETGAILWQTYTITDAQAASGAAGATIWSSPTYDASSNLLYVTTGNNYGNRPGTPTTDTSDAIVALDASDGHVVWKNQRTPNDTWVISYRLSPTHPDADFGDSPKLFTDSSGRRVVAAGQKSGFLHLLDAATGRPLAQRQFLPSGGLGGFFADSAEHGGVIYANGNDWPGYGGGEVGGLAGMIAGQIKPSAPPNAGELVAIRADQPGALHEVWRFSIANTPMLGAVAVANGVVFVHASKEGGLSAIDARTGEVLANAHVGPAVSGPSVAGGSLFMGFGDTFGLAAADPMTGGVAALGLGNGARASAGAQHASPNTPASTPSGGTPPARRQMSGELATTGRADRLIWLVLSIGSGLALRKLSNGRARP